MSDKPRRLHIVMPVSRVGYLGALCEGYILAQESHPWELRWHLMFQGPEPDYKGINKTNEGIECVRDGWMLLLSDDTIQHPSLFRRLHEVVEAHPNAGAVVFNQVRGTWHLQPNPALMVPAQVCGGQVVWNREFVGDTRYDPAMGGITDGDMIKRLYDKAPDRFIFVREDLMYFGSLEW